MFQITVLGASDNVWGNELPSGGLLPPSADVELSFVLAPSD